MGRDEILAFLEAIDAALVARAGEGERLDFYLIGRSALIVRYALNIATKDVDILHFHGTELELKASSSSAREQRTQNTLASTSSPCPRVCHRFRAPTAIDRNRSRVGGVS